MRTLNIFRMLLTTAFYPATALLLSLIFTWLAIRIMPKFGFVDNPGERRIHKIPKPRGGGVAIILSFFGVSVLYGLINGSPELWTYLFCIGPAGLWLMILGLVDDRFSIPGKWKLVGQIIAAVLVWSFGLRPTVIFYYHMPMPLSLIFTVFWVVGFINAFNLIDGMDGLAAGLAVIAGVVLVLWGLHLDERMLVIFVLIFIGSCLGFLWFNFAPAKIFMGDTGSMFLGFFFASISLTSMGKTSATTSLLIPIIAAGVPFFDAILAFLRRSLRKLYPNAKRRSGVMTADQDHLHHRLLRVFAAGLEHRDQRKVALAIYILAAGFCLAGFLAIFLFQRKPWIGVAFLIVVIVVLLRRFATVETADMFNALKHGVKKPRKTSLLLFALPFCDIAILVLVFFFSVRITLSGIPFSIAAVGLAVLPTLSLFLLSRTYRVYFFRSSLYDFRQMAELAVLGTMISGFVIHYIHFADNFSTDRSNTAAMIIFCTLSVLAMIFVRGILCYMGNVMSYQLKPIRTDAGKILIIGGGTGCRIYLDYMRWVENGIPNVVGILDDDESLKKLHLFGLTVHGSLDVIDQVHEKTGFDTAVLTTKTLRKAKLIKLQQFCHANKINLIQMKFEQKKL